MNETNITTFTSNITNSDSYTQNTAKYLHCYKSYKCNNYENNKHNLISKSGYRFTPVHCTTVQSTDFHNPAGQQQQLRSSCLETA